MATPVINGLSVVSGSVLGGTSVIISGANFDPAVAVTFAGTPVLAIAYSSPGEITVTTPAHAAGTVSIVVTNPGPFSATLVNGYIYEQTSSLGWSYETEASPDAPKAVIAPGKQDAVVSSVVRLDGRASYSPSGLDLTYVWAFTQIPIGSQVRKDGFRLLEDDSSVVSFSPDVTGIYEISLVVNDGSFDSVPVIADVTTKAVLVPQNQGIVPDASWIWNYLSDFWSRVDQRTRFETIWSSAIQVVAAEQLKLWQYDYNKSIKDIQELLQRRWLKYEPALPLDGSKTTFILADDQAGLRASTFVLDSVSNAPAVPQPLLSNLISVPSDEGTFSSTYFGLPISLGRVLTFAGQGFTLARSGVLTRAVNYGSDGSVASGGNIFQGSAFDTSLVGMRIKILSGVLSGSVYKIITFTNSHTLVVENLDGSATSFSVSAAALKYSIYPATTSQNAFFADRNLVPTGQSPIPWRFSATLASTQYDFEAHGVAAGDVLVVQIVRQDNQKSAMLNLQVTSVDRSRIGFALNTEDLVDGVAAGGLSKDDQIALATALGVPGLLVSTTTQDLVYTDQSAAIESTVTSLSFRRSYFERALVFSDLINIGPFSVVLKPLKIIRNSAIKVDDLVRSVPSLQEYVKQPDIIERDGQLFQLSEGKFYLTSHRPYTLFENLDYILDDDRAINGLCNLVAGSDLVQVPYGDLVDRSLVPGDMFTVTDGSNEYVFTLLGTVDPETLRVSPSAPVTVASSRFSITRRVNGNFLRFVGQTFTKKNPAPSRLWAEVSFFDNNDAVENNFGFLVGVSQEDLARQGATIPYKSSVAGLMYALTNGPTIANLQLASQILLGLPFTQYAGVVEEIDPDYKTRDDGSPLYGRILINAQDKKGKSLGVTSIYLYPQGRQIEDPLNPGSWLPAAPEFSGLAINPETGAEYVVGDTVTRFAALSKGTQVQDYINAPSWVQRFVDQGDTQVALQQYHSFQIVVNADVTTAGDTDLVAQFLRRARPTYTKLSLGLFKSLEDIVQVDDSLFFKRAVDMDDNVSLSTVKSLSVDQQSVDGSYTTIDGKMFAYMIYGEDLSTVQGDTNVHSDAGGFVSARAGESHDEPFLPAYDVDFGGYGSVLKILGGPNQGMYFGGANGDTDFTLVGAADIDGNPVTFETLDGQAFVIYRLVGGVVTTGPAVGTVGSSTVTTSSMGLFSSGAAVGDRLCLSDPVSANFSSVYTISAIDAITGDLTIVPTWADTNGGGIYAGMGVIFRERLRTNKITDPSLPRGLVLTVATGDTFGDAAGAGGFVDRVRSMFLQIGDLVTLPNGEVNELIDVDPHTMRHFFRDPWISNGTFTCAVTRPSQSSTPLSLDLLDRIPDDYLFLSLKTRSIGSGGSGPDLVTTNGSPTVTTVSGINWSTLLGVIPGDCLLVLEGTDSTKDVGYGAGVFPIREVSGTNLILTRPLAQSHAAPGILYGIMRRRPNER